MILCFWSCKLKQKHSKAVVPGIGSPCHNRNSMIKTSNSQDSGYLLSLTDCIVDISEKERRKSEGIKGFYPGCLREWRYCWQNWNCLQNRSGVLGERYCGEAEAWWVIISVCWVGEDIVGDINQMFCRQFTSPINYTVANYSNSAVRLLGFEIYSPSFAKCDYGLVTWSLEPQFPFL